MSDTFINKAFTKAINDYLESCDNPQGIMYNSFLTVVVRLLISIYSELDIVNPMIMCDENLLKDNLGKFGYSKENIELFLSNIESFYDLELEQNKQKNPYFITIQKELIDMLIKKKLNFYLTEQDLNEFYNLLYTPYCNNPLRLSYNYLMSSNVLEIDEYFKKEMKDNVKVILPKEKHYLTVDAYEILGYSMDDIRNLEPSEVDKINTQVYDYFKIRENAINKEYLLEKAIDALKKENNKLTSGNGYVDILLVLSIICTIVMVVGIFAFIIV